MKVVLSHLSLYFVPSFQCSCDNKCYEAEICFEFKMTIYNSIAEEDADDECRLWIRKLLDARDEGVAFTDARLDGQGEGEYLGFFKNSFILSLHIGCEALRPSALIRFPKPG